MHLRLWRAGQWVDAVGVVALGPVAKKHHQHVYRITHVRIQDFDNFFSLDLAFFDGTHGPNATRRLVTGLCKLTHTHRVHFFLSSKNRARYIPPVALTFIQKGLVNFTKSHLIADLLVVLLLVPITGKWFFVSHGDMFRKEKPNFHLFQ